MVDQLLGGSLNELRRCLEAESSDSLQLLRNIKENPVCSLTFDESIPCVTVLWKQYATRCQWQFIHECILRLLQKHRADKLLGDDTNLLAVHAEDRTWIIEDWLPRAATAGLKFIASKTPNAHFGRISVNSVLSKIPEGIMTRSFGNLDEAKQWLRKTIASHDMRSRRQERYNSDAS